MATFSTNEFKPGLKLIVGNDPCVIIDYQFVKPGKGQAFTRVKLRNLKTNHVLEKTYKSGESVAAADIVECNMQYLYSDGVTWYFMDQDSFEQYAASATVVADAKQWLKGEEQCIVTLWNQLPLSVTPPNFVTLIVADTDPGLKGDSVQGGSKLAVLETGATVKVPLFIEVGTAIKIDTRTSEYISRSKIS